MKRTHITDSDGLQITDEDFAVMHVDVLMERERRLAAANPRGPQPGPVPANRPGLARLANLEPDDFQKLSVTVFEELSIREILSLYKNSNPPRQDAGEWLVSFRSFQDKEEALAKRAAPREFADMLTVDIPVATKVAANQTASVAVSAGTRSLLVCSICFSFVLVGVFSHLYHFCLDFSGYARFLSSH